MNIHECSFVSGVCRTCGARQPTEEIDPKLFQWTKLLGRLDRIENKITTIETNTFINIWTLVVLLVVIVMVKS